MNKWKIGFWICLSLLVITIVFGLYAILDQGVTITYMKEGYEDKQEDLNAIIEIVNKTDLTKGQIQSQIKRNKKLENITFDADTAYLNSLILIFKDNKLKEVKEQW